MAEPWETPLFGEREVSKGYRETIGRKHICLSGTVLGTGLFLASLQTLKVLSIDHVNSIKDAWGLPWWRSGWESACQCRGHGFEPWSGKIPHAAEQLGPWATATEPARLEPVLRNKRGRDGERPAHRDEEWPPLAATGESPRTETKTRPSQK